MIVYSIYEVMEILSLSRNTIIKYIKNKELKASYIGNQYRIRKESLDEFLAKHETIIKEDR